MIDDIKVSILTLAYNHELYIRQCLDGIIMQQTNFKFELLIHDDASTDETANIIREYEKKYPNILKPIYQKENQYSKGIPIGTTFLYPRAKGKYIALCEGDDYWIDPYKLQKQVDFLESNPEYSLIYTDYNILDQKKNIIINDLIKSGQRTIISNFEQHLSTRGYIAPMSWLFKKECISLYDNYKGEKAIDTSFIFALEIFLNKKVYYMNDTTCVYRILPNSASHSTSIENKYEYNKNLHNIQLYYSNKYSVSTDTLERLNWLYKDYSYYILAINDKEKIQGAITYLRNTKSKNLKSKIILLLLNYKIGTRLLRLILNFKLISKNIKVL